MAEQHTLNHLLMELVRKTVSGELSAAQAMDLAWESGIREGLARQRVGCHEHMVSPEDRAVLMACIKSMEKLTDKDLEEAKDDEVMGPLATAELARRKDPLL